MKLHDDRPASVILLIYGSLLVGSTTGVFFIANCALLFFHFVSPAPSRSASELIAGFQFALVVTPFTLLVGIAMLVCCYFVARGSHAARIAGQAVIVVWAVGHVPYGWYWLSRPTTFPSLLMELVPGAYGVIAQAVFILFQIVFALLLFTFPIFVLWKPRGQACTQSSGS